MEIQARELRIGNLVFDHLGRIQTVAETRADAYICYLRNGTKLKYKLNTTEPIILTKEWLINFGFIKQVAKVSGGYCYILGGLAVIVKDGIFYFSIRQLQSKYFRTVEYVHTLQNLCFYLTDKELTLSKTNEPL